MTIASKLQAVLTAKEAIRLAVVGKGQSVPTTVPLGDYAGLIDGIVTGTPISGTTVVSGKATGTIAIGDPVVRRFLSGIDGSMSTLPSLLNPPTDEIFSASFTPDGIYIAVQVHSDFIGIKIYKWNGAAYDFLVDLPGTGSNTKYVCFSPDGQYLAVSENSAPVLRLFKRQGDVFTRLTVDIGPLAMTGSNMSWSGDGLYLAVSDQTNVQARVYKRAGDTFTYVGDTAGWTGYAAVSWVVVSPDSSYMVTATAYFNLFKRTGDVFSKIGFFDESLKPCVAAFSPEGSYMACSTYEYFGSSRTDLLVYLREGDVFTQMPVSGAKHLNTHDMCFSPDGNYLLALSQSSPGLYIYKQVNGTWTQITGPTFASGSKMCISGNGSRFAFCMWNVSTLSLYHIENSLLVTKVGNSTQNLIGATDIGVSTTNAVLNEQISMVSIFRSVNGYPI